MTTSVPNGVGAGKVGSGDECISLMCSPPALLVEAAVRSTKSEEDEDILMKIAWVLLESIQATWHFRESRLVPERERYDILMCVGSHL